MGVLGGLDCPWSVPSTGRVCMGLGSPNRGSKVWFSMAWLHPVLITPPQAVFRNLLTRSQQEEVYSSKVLGSVSFQLSLNPGLAAVRRSLA